MSIPSEFAAYTRELDFVNQFIIPLFRRLGFSQIFDLQGANEFGKDIIFGDIDAFGHVNYFAVQAKFVEKIGKGEAETLAKQCKEAFQNPFTHPRKQTQERVGRYYAVNGGDFSDQFRQAFRNAISPELHGCVTCLDGNDLLTIDRGAGLRNIRDLGQRLIGLRNEIRYNLFLLSMGGMINTLNSFILGGTDLPNNRLWCEASATFVTNPAPPLDANKVFDYWIKCRLFNESLNGIDVPFRPRENQNVNAQKGLQQALKVERLIHELAPSIDTALKELGPLVAP